MRILLATDGSECAALAVREVLTRPWPEGTRVRVLTVVEDLYRTAASPLLDAGEERHEPTVQDAYRELHREAETLVTSMADLVAARGLVAETAVRVGRARSEILHEAREWGADLIMLGSHGRRGLRRWRHGTVALAVAQHAPCSVEVVRAPEPYHAGAHT